MKRSRAGVVLGITIALVATLGAQQTSRAGRSPAPSAAAQLQARINKLEEEHAALARSYDTLLASCRGQAEHDEARKTRNADDDLFWIASVNYGITENTAAFMRFGWKVRVHNGLGRNEVFDLTVQFLNKDDLVIDSGRLGVQTIKAFDEQDVTGDVVIRMPAALNVTSAKAIINRHR
jgi:hypothetical protein